MSWGHFPRTESAWCDFLTRRPSPRICWVFVLRKQRSESFHHRVTGVVIHCALACVNVCGHLGHCFVLAAMSAHSWEWRRLPEPQARRAPAGQPRGLGGISAVHSADREPRRGAHPFSGNVEGGGGLSCGPLTERPVPVCQGKPSGRESQFPSTTCLSEDSCRRAGYPT